MLNLRLVQGPLDRAANEVILQEYNRLTSSRIPIDEFERWVQDGPAGPAWHALLETGEGRIVGHTSLIPLRTAYSSGKLIPAKSEYSFVHEEFRSAKIRGHETGRIKFLILVDQLFRHCQTLGWGPFYVSTREANHPLSRRVGCRPAEFSLWECLLVLKPLGAARETPNVKFSHRAALFVAGISQRSLWAASQFFFSSNNGVRQIPIQGEALKLTEDRLSFFEDLASLQWRYQEDQYVRLALHSAQDDYLIAKRGSRDRYLRVCQWKLSSGKGVSSLIHALIRQAESDQAIGVRWAVYQNGADSAQLIRELRRHGFLCASRVRTMMIHTKDEQFLSPAFWNVNDSLFSFDP